LGKGRRDPVALKTAKKTERYEKDSEIGQNKRKVKRLWGLKNVVFRKPSWVGKKTFESWQKRA